MPSWRNDGQALIIREGSAITFDRAFLRRSTQGPLRGRHGNRDLLDLHAGKQVIGRDLMIRPCDATEGAVG